MARSAVPNAIAQLLVVLRARPTLQAPAVVVLDGPPTGDLARADVVAVGWSLEADQAAVEFVQDFNAAGARTKNEEFSINGVIDVWSGSTDVPAVRARAFDLFGEIEDAIRASGPQPTAPNLNGAVLWAQVSRGSLRQSFTDQGARVALGWTVSCHARI